MILFRSPTKDDPPRVGDVFKIRWGSGVVDIMMILEIETHDDDDISWWAKLLNTQGSIVQEWVFQDEMWLSQIES